MVKGEVDVPDSETNLTNTDRPRPNPFTDDNLQELDLNAKLAGKGDKFNVELSNLSLVRGKGGGVMLRFNLSWWFHDSMHGWLGDTSVGCLAFRDREGTVHWANHKLSFGGPFSKAVHSPTPGYYNLVLGIITGSKFEEKLIASDPWGRGERKKQRDEAKGKGEIGTLEKFEDESLGDEDGKKEEGTEAG